MIAAGYTVMAACLAFAVLAPVIARRLSPDLATRLLVCGSLAVAGCTTFGLGLVSMLWVGQLPLLARVGTWSPDELHDTDPMPRTISAVSLALLTALVATALVEAVRRTRALLAVYRTVTADVAESSAGVESPGVDDSRAGRTVVVVPDARPMAFSTPAPGGRVVITTGLLDNLSPSEQRVVLAHEFAHLRHLHSWWRLAAEFAAALNPSLRPTARAVGHAVERWADEDAASVVGDREQVARTLARVALLGSDTNSSDTLGGSAVAGAIGGTSIGGSAVGSAPTVAATGGDVPSRVRALLAPPPAGSGLGRVGVVLLAVVLLAGVFATATLERTGDTVFDNAAGRSMAKHHATGHHVVVPGQLRHLHSMRAGKHAA